MPVVAILVLLGFPGVACVTPQPVATLGVSAWTAVTAVTISGSFFWTVRQPR